MQTYDSTNRELTIKFTQSNNLNIPLLIPIKFGLLDVLSGKNIFQSPDHSELVLLSDMKKSLVIRDIDSVDGKTPNAVISMLRDFSAPIIIEMEQTDQQLDMLARCDTDPFVRHDSLQQLHIRYILNAAKESKDHFTLNENYMRLMKYISSIVLVLC